VGKRDQQLFRWRRILPRQVCCRQESSRPSSNWQPVTVRRAFLLVGLTFVVSFVLTASAAVRTSAHYQIACDGIVTASGLTRSASYSLYSVLEAVPGTATSSNYVVHSGCFGYIAEQRRDIIFDNGFD
jgi:hypothetical protein